MFQLGRAIKAGTLWLTWALCLRRSANLPAGVQFSTDAEASSENEFERWLMLSESLPPVRRRARCDWRCHFDRSLRRAAALKCHTALHFIPMAETRASPFEDNSLLSGDGMLTGRSWPDQVLTVCLVLYYLLTSHSYCYLIIGRLFWLLSSVKYRCSTHQIIWQQNILFCKIRGIWHISVWTTL